MRWFGPRCCAGQGKAIDEENRSKTRRQRKEGICWINRETEKGKIRK